jgi:hypothetical protein
MADDGDMGIKRPLFWSPKRRGITYLALASTLLLLNVPRTDVVSGPSFTIAHQEDFKRVPIVMVVFDEFPAVSVMDRTGAIDERLYPHLARLARSSTWYRNTTTTGVFTHEALPALLTGRTTDRATMMTDIHPRNLFTLLGSAYDIRTYEDLPGFCPNRFCDLERPPRSEGDLGPLFSSFGRGERGTWWGTFLNMIEPARAKGRQPFYFSHLVHPHAPWRYLATGQRYLEDEPVPGEVDIPGPGKAWGSNGWLTNQMWQRHLMQAAHTDRLIGSLIDRLEATGLYDEALVIITADHGVAFEAGHPKRRIDSATIGHVGHVPLFIKAPGQIQGWIDDAPREVTDVLPTIADILELSETWAGVEGSSALDPISSHRRRIVDDRRISPDASELKQVLARKFSAFGHTGDSLDLFGLAPRGTRRLLGRTIDDVTPFSVGTDEVVIDDAELEITDPNAPMFPALLEGTVAGGDGGELVAISVNGIVQAVTRTYEGDGEAHFYSMLDPSRFGAVPNDVQAFIVEQPLR